MHIEVACLVDSWMWRAAVQYVACCHVCGWLRFMEGSQGGCRFHVGLRSGLVASVVQGRSRRMGWFSFGLLLQDGGWVAAVVSACMQGLQRGSVGAVYGGYRLVLGEGVWA